MPNLNDIAALADSLERHHVAIGQERCVRVRNRNAKCARCLEACPQGAIAIEGNRVEVSASLCVNCGACVTACPTEALASLQPTEGQLLEGLRRSLGACGNRVVVACARIASKRQADPALYVEVPCLARADESLLLQAAALGAAEVLLVDGGCATCRLGACDGLIGEVGSDANAILAGTAHGVGVTRSTGFPPELQAPQGQGAYGSTRRGFFTDAADAMKETTLSAARAALDSRLGAAGEPSLGDRLRVTGNGSLPQFPMARRDRALDAMDGLAMAPDAPVGERLFATVSIDGERCNACGMCATFCPTGALRRGRAGRNGKVLESLEFLASDCVACGLCADVCWKDCLSLDRSPTAGELFDLEPREFFLGPPTR